MELFKASYQWAKRPDDQRYSSLVEMRAASENYSRQAREALVEIPKVHITAKGKEIYLNGSSGSEAKVTNWGFGQLCSRVRAPAAYLRELPANLAAKTLTTASPNLLRRAGIIKAQTSCSIKAMALWCGHSRPTDTAEYGTMKFWTG